MCFQNSDVSEKSKRYWNFYY